MQNGVQEPTRFFFVNNIILLINTHTQKRLLVSWNIRPYSHSHSLYPFFSPSLSSASPIHLSLYFRFTVTLFLSLFCLFYCTTLFVIFLFSPQSPTPSLSVSLSLHLPIITLYFMILCALKKRKKGKKNEHKDSKTGKQHWDMVTRFFWRVFYRAISNQKCVAFIYCVCQLLPCLHGIVSRV